MKNTFSCLFLVTLFIIPTSNVFASEKTRWKQGAPSSLGFSKAPTTRSSSSGLTQSQVASVTLAAVDCSSVAGKVNSE